MNSKPRPNQNETASKPVRKERKMVTESGRIFIDVDEVLRRTVAIPLRRYVE